jgi:hypothetical protein
MSKREIVLLGGPAHRRRIYEDDSRPYHVVHSYRCRGSNSYNKFSTSDSQIDYFVVMRSDTYIELRGVSYYKGEKIYVHEKFDFKKSKIIKKLERRKNERKHLQSNFYF